MAKLTEYPQATAFDEGDILIKDGINGTKKILVSDALKDMNQNKTTLAHVVDTYLALSTSDVEDIPASAGNTVDLNTYTTPGNYRVMLSDNIQYIENAPPLTAPFRIVVMQASATNRTVQIAIAATPNNDILAVRGQTGSLATWRNWKVFATNDYVDNKVSTSAFNKIYFPCTAGSRWSDNGSSHTITNASAFVRSSDKISTVGHKSLAIVLNKRDLPSETTGVTLIVKQYDSMNAGAEQIASTPFTATEGSGCYTLELESTTVAITINLYYKNGSSVASVTATLDDAKRLSLVWGEEAFAQIIANQETT